MSRRRIIAGLVLMLTTPLVAEAQPAGKVPVVGVLTSGSGPRPFIVDSSLPIFRELGYIEGQTIVFVFRFSGGKPEAFPELAADLVRRKVDLILAGGPAAVRAVKNATSEIPIVALDLESNPVQAGFVRSFAQPAGNLTGCFLDQPGLTGKWLELIDEVVAGGPRRLAVLVDTTTGPWQLAAVKAAAEKRKFELQVIEIRGATDLVLLVGDRDRGRPGPHGGGCPDRAAPGERTARAEWGRSAPCRGTHEPAHLGRRAGPPAADTPVPSVPAGDFRSTAGRRRRYRARSAGPTR